VSNSARTSSPGDRPVTMKDVARAAGVSQSTVSRILSDTPLPLSISDATRGRVHAAARSLGYRPNPFARALRGAPSMLLGAIVRDITDPFLAAATEALSLDARRLGYNIVLGLAHGSATEALELAAVLEARQCDAIVILGDMQHQPQLLDDLRAAEVPVVALWQGSELHDISAVNVDNAKGVAAAVRHLHDLGHDRISFISTQLLGDIRERQAAYVDAVGPVPEGYLQHVANSPAGGADALAAMLRLPEPPTAVIASTDVVAMGVLHAAAERGLTVPADLSVVGFDDIPLARFCVPALTTVRMPTTEMVAAAAGLVAQALGRGRGEQSSPVVRLFDPELVVRKSSAPPPAGRPRAALERSEAR
jgi:DNA-binding LacI/PurR family transcriptional regulator